MRYCTGCRRLTAGDPLFCGTCGRTYGVRLCPRHHVNGRRAEVCTECGSRELTEPAPPAPAGAALLGAVFRLGAGALLLACSVALAAAFLHTLLTSQEVQGRLMLLLLLLGMGWWAYVSLPPGMRQAARWGWRAAKRTVSRKR